MLTPSDVTARAPRQVWTVFPACQHYGPQDVGSLLEPPEHRATRSLSYQDPHPQAQDQSLVLSLPQMEAAPTAPTFQLLTPLPAGVCPSLQFQRQRQILEAAEAHLLSCPFV